MFSARKIIEFEAKVIQDIVAEIEGCGGTMGNIRSQTKTHHVKKIIGYSL